MIAGGRGSTTKKTGVFGVVWDTKAMDAKRRCMWARQNEGGPADFPHELKTDLGRKEHK